MRCARDALEYSGTFIEADGSNHAKANLREAIYFLQAACDEVKLALIDCEKTAEYNAKNGIKFGGSLK
jgi:hypothetical protein